MSGSPIVPPRPTLNCGSAPGVRALRVWLEGGRGARLADECQRGTLSAKPWRRRLCLHRPQTRARGTRCRRSWAIWSTAARFGDVPNDPTSSADSCVSCEPAAQRRGGTEALCTFLRSRCIMTAQALSLNSLLAVFRPRKLPSLGMRLRAVVCLAPRPTHLQFGAHRKGSSSTVNVCNSRRETRLRTT